MWYAYTCVHAPAHMGAYTYGCTSMSCTLVVHKLTLQNLPKLMSISIQFSNWTSVSCAPRVIPENLVDDNCKFSRSPVVGYILQLLLLLYNSSPIRPYKTREFTLVNEVWNKHIIASLWRDRALPELGSDGIDSTFGRKEGWGAFWWGLGVAKWGSARLNWHRSRQRQRGCKP